MGELAKVEWTWSNIMSISRRKMDIVQMKLTRLGVNVQRYDDCKDSAIFRNMWKADGVLGAGAVAHGAWDDRYGWSGVFAGGLEAPPTTISYVSQAIPYKLASIIMYSCGAVEMGWGSKGLLLSQDGVFDGYSGSHTQEDEPTQPTPWYDKLPKTNRPAIDLYPIM